MKRSKDDRQSIIRSIITSERVGGQEELIQQLKSRGCEVTQATLSRDLKELKVTKLHTSDHGYIYTLSSTGPTSQSTTNTSGAHPGFISIQFANHLGVIKTRPGYASSIAYDVDQGIPHEIIGTIAGDDTILIIPREGVKTETVLNALSQIIINIKENVIQ